MEIDSSQNLKNELRSRALARRDALSVEERADAAKAIAAIKQPVELPRGVVVAGYSPINSEFDPFPFMRAFADRGAALALHRACSGGGAETLL